MEAKRKKLWILAGFSIFLIFIFMIIALLQFQKKPTNLDTQELFQFDFNKNWTMFSLDCIKIPQIKQEDYNQIHQRIKDTQKIENCEKIDLPYTQKNNSNPKNTILVFKNILSEEYTGLTLHISSENAMVHIFINDKLIYEYGLYNNTNVTEKPPEKKEHLVVLPTILEKEEIWIELSSLYPDKNAKIALNDIKITPPSMVIGIFGNSIADIGCCLLMIIMAIILFMLALIRKYTLQLSRGELYLGLFALAAGVYYFIETDTLSTFYNIQAAYELQHYLPLLFSLLLSLYFEWNLHTIYPHRFFILSLITIGNAIIQAFLQTLKIQSFTDIIFFSSTATCLVCITSIISLQQLDYKKRPYQSLPLTLSILLLLLGEIINTIIQIILKEDIYYIKITQYSTTIFTIMIAIIHVLQISKEYRLSVERNAKLLEEKIKITEQQNTQLIQAKKEADIAKHEALAANEAKGKFLAHMSHEIRTPINAVLGMDEMILRESKEQTIKEYAMDIYTAGQTLLSLINDILDFSKIESGKMELVPVKYDVSSFIHDLTTMASQKAKNKNLDLKLEIDSEIPSILYGDDVRIRQILTNILTNAIKYTQKGTVFFRIQSYKKEKDIVTLHFEVEDTGIGIKEEDLPKLFTEFERIEENRNRNIEGTGLGMSITIQLLTLLGSKLQVESVYGKGSKFYFELKQKIIDPTIIGNFESRIYESAKNYNYTTKFYAENASILVVDDNAMNRKVLQSLLKETKIQLTEAESGMECLKLVQEHHYDLIFLDHMMPEMDGIETLHHIKNLPNCPCKDTPIIVLTANAVSGAKENYLSEGFYDFLSKPVIPEKLETMIKKTLPKELIQETTNEEQNKNITRSPQTKTEATEIILEDLPQVDGLDWNYALLHLPDKELLEYTVKEFYAQIDSAANHLESAYHEITNPVQLEQYRIQVHAMKSLAATIGIISLSGMAKILENAARNNQIDIIVSMTTIFLKEWRSYHEKLQNVFNIGNAEKEEATDLSMIQALIEIIRLSMEEMDIDQADTALQELQSYQYSNEITQTIQKLAQAVTNLDSEETSQIANLLIQQLNTKNND